MQELDVFDSAYAARLTDSRRVLVAGAGGGFDVFAGLPLFFSLRRAGKQVFLANLSFSYLGGTNAVRLGQALTRVDASSAGETEYFPEKYLAEWLRDEGCPRGRSGARHTGGGHDQPCGGPRHKRAHTARREVMDEQVLAYCDFSRHHVVARSRPPRFTKQADAQIGVLVHEIVHALQDQHFSHAGPVEFDDQDGRLAFHAVLEGDATLTMIAYLAGERGVPLPRAIRRAADLSRNLPIESLVAGEGGAALRNAPPILRAHHLFPYLAGTSMLAELYRAGGLPLLNLLYTRPHGRGQGRPPVCDMLDPQ